MHPYDREQELLALQSISETLNRSNDTQEMLQAVLTKLLEVTGLKSGWIFLANQAPNYTCLAKTGLPPALSWGDDAPMCSGTCWCLDRLWDGRLNRAVNIISCKRIEDAVRYKWGDTQQMEHHASIPLKAGEELMGVLNVASPGKQHFSPDELALLQAVAYQIGSAVKRTLLFQAERKRAERLTKLGELTGWIAEHTESGMVSEQIVQRVSEAFQWPSTTLYLREGNELYLRARYVDGNIVSCRRKLPLVEANPVTEAIKTLTTVTVSHNETPYLELVDTADGLLRSAIAVPIYRSDIAYGVLLVSDERPYAFEELDVELLESIGGRIALSIDKARLMFQRRELARQEERHKLARDLHDSVSQTLFSLSLTARGAESLPDTDRQLLQFALSEMQQLAQNALQEMRSLIWQLRPPGLELGIATGLAHYGERLGLSIRTEVTGLGELPQLVEEALWRIGQEALNNVSKHGETSEVAIALLYAEEKVILEVADQGKGFDSKGRESFQLGSTGMGLLGMQERAVLVGGSVQILSQPDHGTVVKAELPLTNYFPRSLL